MLGGTKMYTNTGAFRILLHLPAREEIQDEEEARYTVTIALQPLHSYDRESP